MTELEVQGGALPDVQLTVDSLLQSDDTQFAELVHTLSVEDLMAAGLVLTAVTKVSSVRVGLTAYEIRQQTPDGEWGRRVFDLAEQWEVSERTIHRWMKGAQDQFQLELTPAQKNSQVSSPPDTVSTESPDWDDEDDELENAGFADLEGYTNVSGGDPEENKERFSELMGEVGWGDETLPSADYTNAETPGATPVTLILEPDDTWVAFTMREIQLEHDGYSDQAAERSAKARWARKLDEDPLDLLEELDMIYEASGDSLPDETIEKLHQAEDNKAIKPDEVTEPKKKRGGKKHKFVYEQAEALLVATRNIAQDISNGLKAGTVDDKQIAAMLPHLESVPYTLKKLIEQAKESKARYLAEHPPMAEKIAETVAAEETSSDF